MRSQSTYISPEILKIEIHDADVVTESGVETPSVTFPWQKLPNQTPGSEL